MVVEGGRVWRGSGEQKYAGWGGSYDTAWEMLAQWSCARVVENSKRIKNRPYNSEDCGGGSLWGDSKINI